MDVVEDPAQKALLAEALLAETEPPAADTVTGRDCKPATADRSKAQLRDLRAQIAEAERRGDFAELASADAAEAGAGPGAAAVAGLSGRRSS